MTPHPRSHCPECGSMTVNFYRTYEHYRCRQCGWTGKEPQVKLQDYWGLTGHDLQEWEDRLQKIRVANPDYSRKDLIMCSMLGEGAVDRYLKQVRQEGEAA